MRQTDVILLWILFTYLLVPYADVEGKSVPPNQWNVLLHTKPGQYLKIDCEDLIEYDINLFPNVSLGDVTDFRIRYCPLPGDSFKPTMDLFNISRFEDMTLDGVNINNSTGKKVTKQLFDGLSELKTLYFSSLVPINLESDFLENLPNLRQLQLQNTIDKIYPNMFNYTPKLEILHLSQNLISELPNRVFQNLPDLRMLHLWNNQLTSLENETFAGLGQLTSLELSNNQIVHLDDDTFSDLVHLVNISLRRNKLKKYWCLYF
ncbi:hypothetical protein NQ317_008174 [Molorchus minor]|uniref:Uncharacterized protein n=1 Tax=Molorchus minor TaxID=1323400 RepID=A0ABQ9J6D7_9CUCU|nr:hypothetical protein NQ317_008174 [Molorchus minor]